MLRRIIKWVISFFKKDKWDEDTDNPSDYGYGEF